MSYPDHAYSKFVPALVDLLETVPDVKFVSANPLLFMGLSIQKVPAISIVFEDESNDTKANKHIRNQVVVKLTTIVHSNPNLAEIPIVKLRTLHANIRKIILTNPSLPDVKTGKATCIDMIPLADSMPDDITSLSSNIIYGTINCVLTWGEYYP